MIEVLPRGSERARRISWSSSILRDGDELVAVASDAGRFASPSRFARLIATRAGARLSSGSGRVVIRWVPHVEAFARRPPLPILAWSAVRPAYLTASAFPVVLGLASAGTVKPLRGALVLTTVMAMQAAATLLCTVFDHVTTDETLPRSGGSRVLQLGWASARSLALAGLVLGVLALGLGTWLVATTGQTLLLAFGAGAALVSWQFSAPPLRLRRGPASDLALMLIFGPALSCAAGLASFETVTADAVAAGVIAGVASGLRRQLGNLRKIPGDAMRGHRTVAHLLGFIWSKRAVALLALATVALPPLLHPSLVMLLVALAFGPLFAWAVLPAVTGFAPHDPALRQAIGRAGWMLHAHAAAVVVAWLVR